MAGDIPPAFPDDVRDQLRLLEKVVEAVVVCRRDGTYLHLSQGAATLIGRPGAELVGRRIWDAAPDRLDTPLHAAWARAVLGGEPVDLTWYSSLQDRWLQQRIVPFGELILIASWDVTARESLRLRRDQLLHVSEALARTVSPEEVAEVVAGLLLADLPVKAAAVIAIEPYRPATLLAATGFGRDALRELTGVAGARAAALAGHPADPGREAERSPGALAGSPDQDLTWVPLRAGRSFLGLIVLARDGVESLAAEQVEYLRSAAAAASQALSRTLRSATEHRAAVTLQRSLLPEVGGRIGQVGLAARYLPGDPGVEVGGDWFDAVPAGEGLFLIVGDVQGHDIEAAAIMGQLRSVLRAYAAEGLPPAGILRRADQYLTGLDAERIVTVLIVYLHGEGEIATLACAGHPLPLLLAPMTADPGPACGTDRPGWTCRELGVTTGPPLGVPGTGWREVTELLPTAATLLLYTDGLVETAAWGGSERGTVALHQVLRRMPADASPDTILDRALEVIPAGLRGDDVAVLVARVAAQPDHDGRSAQRWFSAHAMSVPLARSWLRGLLAGWDLAGVTDSAELVLSELLSNAVRNSEEPVEVLARAVDDEVVVEVFDRSHRLPIPRDASEDDPSGRGLVVTEALSREWGVRERLDGKVVWARIGELTGRTQVPGG